MSSSCKRIDDRKIIANDLSSGGCQRGSRDERAEPQPDIVFAKCAQRLRGCDADVPIHVVEPAQQHAGQARLGPRGQRGGRLDPDVWVRIAEGPDEEGPGVLLATESRGLHSSVDVPPGPSASCGHAVQPFMSGFRVADGRRRSGRVLLGHDAPVRSFHHRAGSKATWSRTKAKATRLARCPSAHATTPGPFPLASSSLAYLAKSGCP